MMGYVVNVKYHPKKNGEFGFDMNVSNDKSFKLGKKEEEIDHSQLASFILKQLSRRDVLVHDVEVIEFVRKVIKVKESNNGIIIGNKKYIFDDAVKDLISTEEIDERPRPNNPVVAPAPPKKNILRREFFNPEIAFAKSASKQFKQMGLTIGKQYNVVNEIGYPGERGSKIVTKYTVVNDSGGTIDVPIEHFSATMGILGEGDFADTSDIQLSYDGEVNVPSINLR